MEFQFKKDIPDLEKRKEQFKILQTKHPNKIPIILEKDPLSKFEGIQKTRHLINKDFTVSKFQLMIKKLLKLPEEEALFLSAKGKYNITGEKSIEEIYRTYKDKQDGFLYVMYSSELVYG